MVTLDWVFLIVLAGSLALGAWRALGTRSGGEVVGEY